MEIGDSINVLENSLRDLVERVLRKTHDENWFDQLGVPQERVDSWVERREEEPKRRPGGQVEDRLLYYAELHDIIAIIKKNWAAGFKDCFRNLKRFDVYTDRLSAFRNPDAHSRALLPFEEQLLLGMTGELRQAITLFLSSGAGGQEPEYFARIEEGRDSYGTRVVGAATGGKSSVTSPAVLRPGDTVSFVGRAWDPEGGALEWEIFLAPRRSFEHLSSAEIGWEWQVGDEDISESSFVNFSIRSARPYYRNTGKHDDEATLYYRVLPRK